MTATATKLVKDDIIKRLGIEDNVVFFQSSYNRPNLFYDVRDKRENTTGFVEQDIAKLIKEKF